MFKRECDEVMDALHGEWVYEWVTLEKMVLMAVFAYGWFL